MTFRYPLDPVRTLRPPPRGHLSFGDAEPAAPPVPTIDWSAYCNPARSQGTAPSCGGQAVENALEAILRRDAPEKWLHGAIRGLLGHLRWQFDGKRLYDIARAHFAASADPAGGLYQDEIGAIPELTGILGPHRIRRVPPGWANRHRALLDGPLCIGLRITESWERPDPDTGYIRPQETGVIGGHEVCIVDGHMEQGHWFDVVLNSWGPGWGRHGLAVVNGEWLDWMQMDDATQWLPTDRGWYERSTWRDFVIPSRDDV